MTDGGKTKYNWSSWGDVVLKMSLEIEVQTIVYLQMEIEVLKSLNSKHYPTLYYHNIFVNDPESGEKLPSRILITIEERIQGMPLAKCMHEYRTEKQVVDLITSLVNALSLLWTHERKLVHRDLKPDNILIRPDGEVVIIDLGIMRETGSVGVTASAAPFGPLTCFYASPEQVRNDKRNISFKTDVFALATIAYELLTGTNPYGVEGKTSFGEVLQNVETFVPIPLAKRGIASKQFSEIVERMMQKEPFKRYRSVEYLKADLLSLREKV